jgi:hypothetical protein
MPTDNYSHIGVREKHMVDREGLGDNGGEDDIKIPLPQRGEEDQSGPQNKDHGGGECPFRI